MLPKQSISRLAILTILTVSSLCLVITKPALASSDVDSHGNYIKPFPYPFTWSMLIAGGIAVPQTIMTVYYMVKMDKRRKGIKAARLLRLQQSTTKKEETES